MKSHKANLLRLNYRELSKLPVLFAVVKLKSATWSIDILAAEYSFPKMDETKSIQQRHKHKRSSCKNINGKQRSAVLAQAELGP